MNQYLFGKWDIGTIVETKIIESDAKIRQIFNLSSSCIGFKFNQPELIYSIDYEVERKSNAGSIEQCFDQRVFEVYRDMINFFSERLHTTRQQLGYTNNNLEDVTKEVERNSYFQIIKLFSAKAADNSERTMDTEYERIMQELTKQYPARLIALSEVHDMGFKEWGWRCLPYKISENSVLFIERDANPVACPIYGYLISSNEESVAFYRGVLDFLKTNLERNSRLTNPPTDGPIMQNPEARWGIDLTNFVPELLLCEVENLAPPITPTKKDYKLQLLDAS